MNRETLARYSYNNHNSFALAQVELPILLQLRNLGVNALQTLGGVDIFFPMNGSLLTHRNKVMNVLGQAFRIWCRMKKIEKPPSTWDLHMIGRGESDSKSVYPVLDSNIKAAHTKPILFFLSELATEIASHCRCSWVWFCFFRALLFTFRGVATMPKKNLNGICSNPITYTAKVF